MGKKHVDEPAGAVCFVFSNQLGDSNSCSLVGYLIPGRHALVGLNGPARYIGLCLPLLLRRARGLEQARQGLQERATDCLLTSECVPLRKRRFRRASLVFVEYGAA